MSWRERVAALLGVSTYQARPSNPKSLGDPEIDRAREAMGGQIAPLPVTRTRWLLADLERAQLNADGGDLALVGQLYRWMRTDGVLAGHLAARCGKAVRLPRRFSGDPEMVLELTGRDGARSVFDDMFPAAELERLADDGLVCGVGVGELVPVQGRDYPVFVRLDPEHLIYRWTESRWFYRSWAGLLPITPGDGRWILHVPGGRMSPWQAGLWPALGRAAINKAHAELNTANWEGKLANPARVAEAPAGSTDEELQSHFRNVMAWGLNTVFGLKPGWSVKLIESNGRGYESFQQTIERSERVYAIAIRGNVVTSDGGAGFSNADVPMEGETGLIDATADSIAYTINTQGIPQWVVSRYGEQALAVMPILLLKSKPPQDLSKQADTLIKVATGLKAAREELAFYGRKIDIAKITTEYAIPIEGDKDGDGTPDEEERSSPGAAPPAGEPANDTEEAASPDAAAELAQKMTEHGVERCQHGAINRCRLCGVERHRDFEMGPEGPDWKTAWKPISREVAA